MSYPKMFALVDCNNFYASCERLFRPDLNNVPIVVLSNNDGCCIARSNEAKSLGIAMGEPYFKIKALCQQHGVKVFSSNYTLYGNLSHRVMCTIEEAWPHVEIYSIDEAFLDLSTLPVHLHDAFCQKLQKNILKHTGIPTSIGIGATRTLAKIANHICKKVLKISVFNITHRERLLRHIPVGEVWGVGRQWNKKLSAQGVQTAHDLATANIHVLKKCYNVILMRTAMELRGISCNGLAEPAVKQSIVSSKSFGRMQTDFDNVAQAVSSHCARAVEKMRQQGLVAQHMEIFVRTNAFRNDLPQYVQSIGIRFINPTDDLRLITTMAKKCLRKIFKSGFYYKKVGVCVSELVSKNQRQFDLFHRPNDAYLEKTEQLMSVLDKINQKYGKSTLRLAAEGYSKPWSMRAELKSPAYTTCWAEVPKVRV